MNQERDNAPRLVIIVAATLAAVGLILIVMAAIQSDALPQLIGGVVVLGLIVIALAVIGVVLFGKFGKTKLELDTEHHRHVEAMAQKGYLPNNDRYKSALLDEPEDLPVSTTGETDSTVNEYLNDAIELLALSGLEMPNKRDSQQIIPFYKARKNPYFADVDVWMKAVKYLLIKQKAYEWRVRGKNKGTFLFTGTVGELLDTLKAQLPAPPAQR